MIIMNNSLKISGIALIEVLVAAFVVGVGFMSLASMQGGLIDGSRDNKTRAEALALASAKMEELRSTATKTTYQELVDSSTQDTLNGKTESFKRSWTIVNPVPTTGTPGPTETPERRVATVSVCWLGGCSTTNPDLDKRVTLQSIIAFDSLSDAMQAAKTAQSATSSTSLGGPSVNAESSDDIRDAIHLTTATAVGTLIKPDPDDEKKYIVDGTGATSNRAVLAKSCTDLSDFENGLKTIRVNADEVAGDEAIELYRVIVSGGSEYCTPEIRYNGGVIIPIRGIVHSGATPKNNSEDYLSVELFSFNASETGAYCYFKPETGATSAPYACYVGGNCFGVTDATAMDDFDVTKCPVGAYSAEKVGPGGWRGKVGLRGVAGDSTYYNVCMKEEIDATPLTLDTARNYYTRRGGNNEGINKPYSCHDFLIINGKSTEKAVHDECIDKASAIGGISAASKTIQRDISIGNNLFDPVIDTSFCRAGAYTIVGPITGTGSDIATAVQVTDGTTTNSCSGTTATQYTCNITTDANSVTINGEYLAQTVSCTLYPVSSVGCTLAFTPGAPQYIVTGSLSGTAAAISNLRLTVVDGITNTDCQITPPSEATTGSYNCEFQTTSTTGVAINAVAPGYSAEPAAYDLGTLSGTSETTTVLPEVDFSVEAVTGYTVSGKINVDEDVVNESIAVSIPNAESCTLSGSSGSYSYSCTAPAGSSSMTLAINPPCSDKKQNTITSGTNSSSGTGLLVIDFGTNGLSSNISGKDFDITKSVKNCK